MRLAVPILAALLVAAACSPAADSDDAVGGSGGSAPSASAGATSIPVCPDVSSCTCDADMESRTYCVNSETLCECCPIIQAAPLPAVAGNTSGVFGTWLLFDLQFGDYDRKVTSSAGTSPETCFAHKSKIGDILPLWRMTLGSDLSLASFHDAFKYAESWDNACVAAKDPTYRCHEDTGPRALCVLECGRCTCEFTVATSTVNDTFLVRDNTLTLANDVYEVDISNDPAGVEPSVMILKKDGQYMRFVRCASDDLASCPTPP